MYTIIIKGETPSKKNSRVTLANGMTIPSKRYRDWHELASLQLLNQVHLKEPIEECAIEMTFYHGDFRRRDSDNGATSILDLLVDNLVIEDDNWQVVNRLDIRNEYDKNNARVVIKITEAKGKRQEVKEVELDDFCRDADYYR